MTPEQKEKITAARKDALRKVSIVQNTFNTPDGLKTLEILKEEFQVTGRMTTDNSHTTVVRAAHLEVFNHIDALINKDLSDE